MKTLIATLILTATAASALAQGTINIDSAAGAQTKFVVGPDGTTRLAGDGYWVQLFWANGADASESALGAAGNPVNPRTGGAAGVLPAGTIRIEEVTPPGGMVTLQFRGWSAVLGSTETAAFQAWQSQAPDSSRVYGRSGLFNFDMGNPIAEPQPEAPARLGAAFPGLELEIVPEPSTVALGLIGGLGALVLFRRRK